MRGSQRSAAKEAEARLAINYDVVDYTQRPELLVDCKVHKLFVNHGWFNGKVDSYDDIKEYYKLIYTDGDNEDF